MARQSDFLVIGSGIAGLSFALRAAELGTVTVVTKKGTAESATNYAQGGIAAVLGPEDSFEDHVRDTLVAGAGLCREAAVRFVVEHGPEAVRSLIDLGVRFDTSRDCRRASACGSASGAPKPFASAVRATALRLRR